jgi:hypothetical protein
MSGITRKGSKVASSDPGIDRLALRINVID